MTPLKEKEIENAYWSWLARFDWMPGHDEHVASYKNAVPSPPGILRRTRWSLMLSQRAIAEKLKMSHQLYAHLERADRGENLTVARMREIAEALDCDFIYMIKPKKAPRFSRLIWNTLLPDALKICERRRGEDHRRPLVLSGVALELVNSAAQRRRHGWISGRTPRARGSFASRIAHL